MSLACPFSSDVLINANRSEESLFSNVDWSLRTGPLPPPEWNSFPPLVTAVLITPKGADSPGSRRIGVIGALVLIFPSETV